MQPATDSLSIIPMTAEKKEGEKSRLPVCGRGLPLQGKTRYSPVSEHLPLFLLESLDESSTFQTGSEQIANANLSVVFFICVFYYYLLDVKYSIGFMTAISAIAKSFSLRVRMISAPADNAE